MTARLVTRSVRSTAALAHCHPLLGGAARWVMAQPLPAGVVGWAIGHAKRDRREQEAALAAGTSKAPFGSSQHNWEVDDVDADGVPDEEEGDADSDGDGVPDWLDNDGDPLAAGHGWVELADDAPDVPGDGWFSLGLDLYPLVVRDGRKVPSGNTAHYAALTEAAERFGLHHGFRRRDGSRWDWPHLGVPDWRRRWGIR